MRSKLFHSKLEALLRQFDGKHPNLLDRIAADYPADLPLLLQYKFALMYRNHLINCWVAYTCAY